MLKYRRNLIPGGSFFFTVNLLDRRSDLLIRHIALLRDAVRRVRHQAPFHIEAWTVLPDHMHCVWRLPEGDTAYPARWQAIKALFSRSLPMVEPRSAILLKRRERGVWQPRYWEHTIRDERDLAAHIDYTHFNAVKHGLVTHPADWRFSSFHRAVAAGIYPLNWAGGYDVEAAGERR